MARPHLRLQVLALAAAASLLLLVAPSAAHATPPSTDDASAGFVRHGAPRTADVDIHGPRRLGSRHRLLSDDVPPYADVDNPTASSSSSDGGGDQEDARPSANEDGAAADHSMMAFLQRVFGTVIIILLVFSVLSVLLVEFAGLGAAYVADRCASAWRSIKEARKKATRVRPVDADAAGA